MPDARDKGRFSQLFADLSASVRPLRWPLPEFSGERLRRG